MLKLTLFRGEQKHPLNANELLLPAPFQKQGRASRAHAPANGQQQNWTISRIENVRNCQLKGSALYVRIGAMEDMLHGDFHSRKSQ